MFLVCTVSLLLLLLRLLVLWHAVRVGSRIGRHHRGSSLEGGGGYSGGSPPTLTFLDQEVRHFEIEGREVDKQALKLRVGEEGGKSPHLFPFRATRGDLRGPVYAQLCVHVCVSVGAAWACDIQSSQPRLFFH